MEIVANNKLTELGESLKEAFLSIETDQEMEQFISGLNREFGPEVAKQFFEAITLH